MCALAGRVSRRAMSSAGCVKRAAEAAPLFAPPGARLCTDTWITLGTPGVPKNPGKGYCFARFSSSPSRPKVASFDMDGTLVKTAHGGFPASPTDWTWNSEGVARVLRALHASGFELVVFSNQGGIKNAHTGKRAATSKGYFDAALKEARFLSRAFCSSFPSSPAPLCPGWRAHLRADGPLQPG